MQTQAKKEKTAIIEKPTFNVASVIDQYGDAGLKTSQLIKWLCRLLN